MKDNNELIKHKVADFYNQWVREYHIRNYLSEKKYSALQYRQHYIEDMIERQNIPKAARILDVGCGPGELIAGLLGKGFDVWGVDISEKMIEEAVERINKNGFPEWHRASVGDIEKLDFNDSFFDAVVASGVIEYQKDDEKALAEMNRVLKKDGLLILNVTNKYSYLRILESTYTRIKQNAVSRSMLDFIKNRLMRQGKIRDLPAHPGRRVHSPKAFDKQIAAFGFQKISHKYFHFSLLPKPIDSILPFLTEPISIGMEAMFSDSSLGIFGGGYLVIARKVANIQNHCLECPEAD